jgi:hypothetical protein
MKLRIKEVWSLELSKNRLALVKRVDLPECSEKVL